MREVGAILPGDGVSERTLTDSDFLFDRATAKVLLKVLIYGKAEDLLSNLCRCLMLIRRKYYDTKSMLTATSCIRLGAQPRTNTSRKVDARVFMQ